MRTYGKIPRDIRSFYTTKPRESKKAYRERTSTEWDVRLDVTAAEADSVVETISKSLNLFDYVLVSGVEEPDVPGCGDHGASESHVHIAAIFQYPMRRDQVLRAIRGAIAYGDEYCTPRNQKFTYAGWFMHHSKWGWKVAGDRCKLAGEPSIRYEFGILPDDATDEDTKLKVQRMYEKYGSTKGMDPPHDELVMTKFKRWLMKDASTQT